MKQDNFDSLEARILFSTIFPGSQVSSAPIVTNSVLEITGTHKNDVIFVTRESGGSAIPVNVKFAAIFSHDGTVEQILTAAPTRTEIDLPGGTFLHLHTRQGEFYLAAGGITAITVDAGAGDDDVLISTNVKLATTILGGEGNDTLEGSTRADSIDGGAGNDRIFGGKIGTAGNTLIGGDGADTIFGSSEDDNIISPDDGSVDHITEIVSVDDLFAPPQQGFGAEDIVLRHAISSGGAAANP